MAGAEARSSSDTWPAVPLAYEFVRPSYEFLAHRREVIEGRVRGMMTLAVTIMFAAPVVQKAVAPSIILDFGSPWLLGAAGCFIVVLILGILAQVGGRIRMIDPMGIYNTMLHYDQWEFQKNMLFRAGEAFERGASQLNRKGYLADAVGVFLLGQGLFLIAWAFSIPV